ncbi:CHRD domain-containing protein [Candidatus Nitrosocosmicus franklandus]|uniref:CHRD domain protein n=1 Tax=Candidatus Nitrosocosmicus franklandianus TaxID=1798806 RepID=A0A484IDJ0_9ARCH|nr:CHRD domain-containing protein [Candidatus Nitrosocosmicus franklandus]VFJ14876.1 CHRD domain protein [Candidatus Nitrosocosmicus franklandus]
MKINNHVTKSLVLALTAAALTSIAIVSTSLSPNTVFANHEFATNMTGQEEVPPVDTQAIGETILVQDLPLNQTIHYFVNVTGIEGVTQGHIHSGAQGENGPVVVTLFNFESPQSEVLQNGTFAATNLEGPMEGKELSDLIAAMQNGTTYVNVHTEQNPEGEIRGQLVDIP